LRGPETDSKCILEAWQESSSTGRVFTRCRITNEPADLPDGPYQVIFGKHAVKTWKSLGNWELVYLPPEAGTDLMLRSFELAS
jgi:hypothetical protein